MVINISLSFLWKGLSVGLSFFVVPLTVHYLDVVEYGVWITMFTVLNWINMLDVGIGLGLRNKLAEVVSMGNEDAQKRYISTGFYTFVLIGMVALVCVWIGTQFISVQRIFNTTLITEERLYWAFLLTSFIVVLSFVLSIINNVFYAYQMAHYTGITNIVHNGFMLLFLFGLSCFKSRNFIYFIVAYGVAMIISKIGMMVVFFLRRQELLPSVKYYDKKLLKNICNLGVQFFVIQIAGIFLFSSSNILISHCLGVEYVREYDLVFKVFSIITMLHSMVSAPLWNAYTDAYVRRDVVWIKQTLRKMIFLMFPLILGTVILGIVIKPLMNVWLHQEISIDPLLVIGMGLFAIISCWNNVFAMFVNGIGSITVQMYASVLGTVATIPLAMYLMKQIGVSGMIMAIDFVLFLVGIPIVVQTWCIVRK